MPFAREKSSAILNKYRTGWSRLVSVKKFRESFPKVDSLRRRCQHASSFAAIEKKLMDDVVSNNNPKQNDVHRDDGHHRRRHCTTTTTTTTTNNNNNNKLLHQLSFPSQVVSEKIIATVGEVLLRTNAAADDDDDDRKLLIEEKRRNDNPSNTTKIVNKKRKKRSKSPLSISSSSSSSKIRFRDDIDIPEIEKNIPRMARMNTVLRKLEAHADNMYLTPPGALISLPSQQQQHSASPSRISSIVGADDGKRVGGGGGGGGGGEWDDTVGKDEVVLRVSIFPHVSAGQRRKKVSKMYEFLVLGTNSLLELKECIECQTDKILQQQQQYRLEACSFFIEGTFYDYLGEGRSIGEGGIPLSSPVVEFARQKEQEGDTLFKNFKTENMQRTRLSDLEIRLGSHYFYLHAVNERHVMIFNSIRFINEKDIQRRSAYPLVLYREKSLRIRCNVCKTNTSQKVVSGDLFFPSCPAELCNDCFDSFYEDREIPEKVRVVDRVVTDKGCLDEDE